MKACIGFIAIFIVSEFSAFAQQPPAIEIDIEQLIERLFPIPDENIDLESVSEVLFQLYLNPMDLNKASSETLSASYLLDPRLIQNLLHYRSEFGPFISLYELQAVPGFDLITINNLLPFLTLGNAYAQNTQSFWQRVKSEEQAYLLMRHRRVWETRNGFTPADTSATGKISSRYLGDPNDLYLRFRIQHARDFSLGFTFDKDAGEQFIWDRKTARYGFNFLSFHFTKYYVGKWKTISVGDYQAQFGQGLVFGAGYSIGKGAETVPTVRRSSIGILPYTAAMEFGFYRGIGLTRQDGNWQSSLIVSYAPRDGRGSSSQDSLGVENFIINTFSQSGLHRTESELSTKNQFRVLDLGGNLSYAHPSSKFQVGANYLFTRFDNTWIKNPTLYNQFAFSGKQNQVGSLYANYNLKNIFLFGESAISQSGGLATVIGAVSSLSKQVDFSILWRDYDRDFHSFYSNSFGESTQNSNEKGIYLGLQIKPSKVFKINTYYDYFKFPWLRYRAYAPSTGYEWLVKLTYQPKRSLIAFIQLREEQKDRNTSSTAEILLPFYQVLPLKKMNGMISLEYQVNKKFFFRSRILASTVKFNRENTKGFLILQDAQYSFKNFRITGRVALFDTDNYDNRQYTFENNVLWAFSIPAYSGQGMRYYLIGQYQFNSQFTAYLRFAKTNYTNQETISSGLQKINGSSQTETTFEIRYMLHQ